tara:strand:- start:307 stop:504 length:198 start_codon:yes stop_codon:yes gene_type:complete
MKSKLHELNLDEKQIEFLVKCIDISQSNDEIKPDKSEVELIRTLTSLNETIQDEKYDSNVYYDLN